MSRLVVALTLAGLAALNVGCQSSGPKPAPGTSCVPGDQHPDLRPLVAADAQMLGVSQSRIDSMNHSWIWCVARRDFQARPNWQSEQAPAIVVAALPGVGQYAGGDLGYSTLRLVIPGSQAISYIYDPFCNPLRQGRPSVQACQDNQGRKYSQQQMYDGLLRPTDQQYQQLLLQLGLEGEYSPHGEEGLLPLDRNRIWLAVGDFVTAEMYGPLQAPVIVMLGEEARWLGGQMGHTRLIQGRAEFLDPLCWNIYWFGLKQLPLKLPADEMARLRQCQGGTVEQYALPSHSNA